MPDDGRVYDGHVFLFGMDGDTDPSALKNATVAKAVNRVFRGGRNRTRPPFVHVPFEFHEDSKQYEEMVRFGNFQGWHPYRKRKPGREDGIVVSIAGDIFFLTLVNEKIHVRCVFIGNDPRLMHTWFCQAEEWIYVQNGKDRPIFWNGLFPLDRVNVRRSNPDPKKHEMPVGTIMAFIHGRVFLSNAFDQILASDIIFGNGLTKSDNPQRFTEIEYWAGGGYFGMPSDLGPITGMVVMPRQDQNLRGTGELLVLGRDGAQAIEVSISRALWQTEQIQAITLSGRGNVAPASCITVNNDCFFRSQDGLASYGLMRSDQKQSLSFGKLSRHVNPWMDFDTEHLKRFCSSIYFDNRVLTTVSPFIAEPVKDEWGQHRFHRGMVVLDLDQASDVQGDSAFNWDGLWTGIQPCALIKSGGRAYAWSFDHDGENRIYEITKAGIFDTIEGKPVPTEWSYVTRRFSFEESGRSNIFEIKKLIGGELWLSDIRNRIEIGAEYRPDTYPVWQELRKREPFGSDFGDEWKFSLARYGRLKFPTPVNEACKGLPYPSAYGSCHQVKVSGAGAVQIDRMRLAMAGMKIPSLTDSCEPDNQDQSLEGVSESDFEYRISDSR